MARAKASGRRGKAKKAAASASAEDTTADESIEQVDATDDSVQPDPDASLEQEATEEQVDDSNDAAEDTGAVETAPQTEPAASDQHSDDYKKLMEQNVTAAVAAEIDNMFLSGTISYEELTPAVFEALQDFPEDTIGDALKEFAETDFTNMKDKAAHLTSILNTWKDTKHSEPAGVRGPSEAKIKALLERTGFKHEVTSGQRHYGPPSNWDDEPPGHQCEVFFGKLPKDIYEDELVPLCEEAGPLYEMRIMIDPNSGLNRGYAFVFFANKESAAAAISKLNDREVRPGKQIKVNISTPNLRLFVGNLARNKTKEELEEEFQKHVDRLKEVIFYAVSEPDDKRKNRGFCFLEFETHNDAANAKRKLGKPGFKVFNSNLQVDWADPVEEPDDETMSKVKILYVRNISPDVTDDQLSAKFNEHGKVEKFKRVKDYAFVHFETRENALAAMAALDGAEDLGKGKLEVTLARPQSEKARQRKDQRKMEMHANRWGGPPPGRGGWNSGGGWGGPPGGYYGGPAWGGGPGDWNSGYGGGMYGGGAWGGPPMGRGGYYGAGGGGGRMPMRGGRGGGWNPYGGPMYPPRGGPGGFPPRGGGYFRGGSSFAPRGAGAPFKRKPTDFKSGPRSNGESAPKKAREDETMVSDQTVPARTEDFTADPTGSW